MAAEPYPETPKAWRKAIGAALHLQEGAARQAYLDGVFPYPALREWVIARFSTSYSPDFVPALLRNLHGLVAWVYGEEGEPFWPGSDGVHPAGLEEEK